MQAAQPPPAHGASASPASLGLLGHGVVLGRQSVATDHLIRADSLAIRAARPDVAQPRMVMSAAQAVSEIHSPQLPTERLAHRSRPSPVAILLSRAVETNAPRTAARAAAAHAGHTRRPSHSHGHAILATAETVDGPTHRHVATPLDEVPPLFSHAAMEQFQLEKPYLDDVKQVVHALQMITQESAIERQTDVEPAAGDSPSLANSVHVPNVAVGWSGNRRQAVGEMALTLASAVDKLLVDRHPHVHSQSRGGAHPLANLRSEFLSSRELLNLVHSHAAGSTLSELAPALLALSKIYQNRLLEFQGMDALRLEVDPPDQYSHRYSVVKEKEAEKNRKAQAAQRAAAAFIAAAAAKAAQAKRPPEDPEARRLWATLRRKARNSVAFGAIPGGLMTRKRTGSISVPPASGVAAAAAAATAAVVTTVPAEVDPPPMAADSKWRRLEFQGSLDAYLPWNLIRREMHLFAPEMVELTKIFWRACFMDEHGNVQTGAASSSSPPEELVDGGMLVGMPKRIYMHLYTLVHYVLKPSYLPSYAQQCVAQDWLIDIHLTDRPKDAARVLMTLPQFHLGLFNLVDTWTEGVTLEEYVSFLKNLFEFITIEVTGRRAAPAPPAVRTVSLLDSESEESDSETPEDTGPIAPQQVASSSVYNRRLRPLTIQHINALRKLGLRAPNFRELTREMLLDIEAKARAAAAQEAHALRARTPHVSFLSPSDSAASLSLMQSASHEEKEYRGPTLTANKRVVLEEMRPNTRPSSPSIARIGGDSPRNFLRRKSLAGSPGSSPRSSLTRAEPTGTPLTPILTRDAAAEPPSTSPGGTRAAPTWVTGKQPVPPGISSRGPGGRIIPSAAAAAAAAAAAGRASLPSGSPINRRRASLKPSKQQVSEEERKEATELEWSEAELKKLDAATSAATAVVTPPMSPVAAAVASRGQHKKDKPSQGKLSWRMPASMSPDVDESNRLITAELAAMKTVHDALKAANARKREQELLNGAAKELHDLAEGSEEEEDHAAATAAKKRKKRSPGTGSPIASERKQLPGGGEEEKEAPGGAGGRSGPNEGSGEGGVGALSPSPPTRSQSLTSRSVRPGSSPSSVGGGVDRSKLHGRTVQSYDRQRRQFALESAAYLARIDRLRKDAEYHIAAMHQTGVDWPRETEAEDEAGRATSTSTDQLIREEFLPTHDPAVAALQRHRWAGPTSFADHAPVPAYIRQPPAERSALSALDGSLPPPTIRPSSASSSSAFHTGDRRDRIWRLMPQGRFGLVHGEIEPVVRTPQPQRALGAHARPATATPTRRSAVGRPSSSPPGVHSAAGSSRFCDCFSCTELLAPTRASNPAAFHAENMHRLISQEVQPNRAIERLQAMIERV